MRRIWSITRKELAVYFGTPTAFIFLAIFLAATLFIFFWVSGFFARGLADIRPLFRWMPVLLIFLVAALTMRAWSEEQRTGTIESLLTLPVATWQLMLGKFLAVLILVVLALALTLPAPIMVSLVGPLDWGPVAGGYLASLLLAAAYTAIGLFLSALTDNPIVALLTTAVVGGLVYLVGAAPVVSFFSAPWTDILRDLGSGSRFESIERGVIDLRDLVYYLSLAGLFGGLTIYALERKRWGRGPDLARYRRTATITMALAAANLLVVNAWLAPLAGLRADLTSRREYTLSTTTHDLLGNLQEPLLIRAYVSEKSHPLLDPLRPQVEDMLREIAIAGGGKVTAEVVDPARDPKLEAEANQTYGIRPTPFQVADRYQSSLINAYFDILVRYGDQNVVLNFRDLVQVQPNQDGTVEVGLRNLEYDLARSIKKVVYGFQSIDSVLAAQNQPVKVTLFVTPATLPKALAAAPTAVEKVAKDIAAKSNGKLQFDIVNPDDPQSGVTRAALAQRYGLQALPTALFAADSYFLHLLVQNGSLGQVIYPQNDMSEGAVRTALQNAVLRTSTGFLKTIGLWTPPAAPTQNAFGQTQPPLHSYNLLRNQLAQQYSVQDVDLSSGQPPAGIDALLLIAPQGLGEKELFAVDQYLMRGGSLIVLTGSYTLNPDPMTGQFALAPVQGGAADLLRHYGVAVGSDLVMDEQNQPFPVQAVRNANGIQVQELRALNYPFFVDVRGDGLEPKLGVAGSLPGVVLNYASPVTIDAAQAVSRTASTLLASSAHSWLRTDSSIQPDFNRYPDTGFSVDSAEQVHPLAAALQGEFTSYFQGKPNPLAAPAATAALSSTAAAPAPIVAQRDRSPDTARVVVIGSGEFVNDILLNLSSTLVGEQVLENVQYLQNVVDWSMEDTDLLALRTRGVFTRLLNPLDESTQRRLEWITYGIVAVGLLAVVGLAYWWRRSEKPMELAPRGAFQDWVSG